MQIGRTRWQLMAWTIHPHAPPPPLQCTRAASSPRLVLWCCISLVLCSGVSLWCSGLVLYLSGALKRPLRDPSYHSSASPCALIDTNNRPFEAISRPHIRSINCWYWLIGLICGLEILKRQTASCLILSGSGDLCDGEWWRDDCTSIAQRLYILATAGICNCHLFTTYKLIYRCKQSWVTENLGIMESHGKCKTF